MSEKIVVTYEDDLTGKPYEQGETVRFSFDGKQYEVDLAAANARKFRAVLEKHATAGRKVSGKTTKAPRTGKSSTYAVRTWARTVGYEVGAKGRIPANIQAEYDRAHA